MTIRRRRRLHLKRLAAHSVRAAFIILMALFMASALSAQESQGDDGRQSTGLTLTTLVDKASAAAGSNVRYTIIIHNGGDEPAVDVILSDALPAELTFVAGSLSARSGLASRAGSAITWSGSIGPKEEVALTFEAQIRPTVPALTAIVNTATVTWDGQTYSDSAETTVSEMRGSAGLYLPLMAVPLPPPETPTLSVSEPNFANQWTATWTVPAGVIDGYELQEAHTAGFAAPTTHTLGAVNEFAIQHELSINNEYYYRVRAFNAEGPGPWSNVVGVIAGYRDDFTDSIDNWAIRRTTFIEEITLFHEVYQGQGILVFRVEDSWDWGIASPMVKAPPPPYQIEFRSQVANLGNLVSHGVAFGADWPGEICPDWSSLPGIYEHSLCFNHFYLPNYIFYGPLKMQFERVDYLTWCPGCGGSPMKRLSWDYGQWFVDDPVQQANSTGWNTWRYEVRSDGITLFVNGQQFSYSDDSLWVNEPYFGVFGSTDEYSNSTTRYDYVEVRPLDN